MSSTVQKSNSGESGRQYVGFEEYIDYQLKLARRGIRGADLLTGGVGAVLLTVGYLFLFVVTDHWIVPGGWSQSARYLFWLCFVGSLGGWLWARFFRPWSQRVTTLYAATQLETTHPELKSNLLTLVDLQQADRPISPAILEAMERRAAMNLQHVNVDDAVDRQTLTKLSYALLAMVVVLCIYTLASPKSLVSSAWRALFPMANVSTSTRTAISEVKPGNITVLAHATPEIEATLNGVVPPEVRVLYSTADRRVVDEVIQLQDTGEGIRRFRGRLLGENGSGLLQNTTYRIEAGDAVSPTYSITVRQPPTATVGEVFYEYPKYMGLDNRTQADSAIDAWEGTFVTVRATTNVPVDSATILFSDTENTNVKAEELPMQIQGGVNLSARWPLRFRADGTFPRFYRVQLSKKSETGNELVAVPTLHTQRIRADQPPKIEILHPTSDLEVPANVSLPVAYEASDPDFLLKSVVMKFEKDGEQLPKTELLFDAPPFEPKTRGQFLIKLDQFSVEPGKSLTFWLEARDNFEPFGDRLQNLTRSPKITINVINPVEPEQAQRENADQQQRADEKIAAAEKDSQATGGDVSAEQPQEQNNSVENESPQKPEAENAQDAQSPTEDQATPDGNESQSSEAPSPKGSGNERNPNRQSPQEKPQRNRPSSETESKDQPGEPASPSGQPPSEPSSEGQQQPQQGQPKSSRNGMSPQGTEQSRGEGKSSSEKPQQKSTPAGDQPAGQPQPRQSSGQQNSRTRQDKASPDEALEKLIQWQKERDQRTVEQPPSTEPKAEEPASGSEEVNESADEKSSSTAKKEPRSADGKQSKSPDRGDNQPKPKSGTSDAPSPDDHTSSEDTSQPSESGQGSNSSKPKTGKSPAKGQEKSDAQNTNSSDSGRDQKSSSEMRDGKKSSDSSISDSPDEKSSSPDSDPMKSNADSPDTTAPSTRAEDASMEDKPNQNSGEQKPSEKMPNSSSPENGTPSREDKPDGKPKSPTERTPKADDAIPSADEAVSDDSVPMSDQKESEDENAQPGNQSAGEKPSTKSPSKPQKSRDAAESKDRSMEKSQPQPGEATPENEAGQPMNDQPKPDGQPSAESGKASKKQTSPSKGQPQEKQPPAESQAPMSDQSPSGDDASSSNSNSSGENGGSPSGDSGMPGTAPSSEGASGQQGSSGEGGTASKSSSSGNKSGKGQKSEAGSSNSPADESNASDSGGSTSGPMKSSGDEKNASGEKSTDEAGQSSKKGQSSGKPKSGDAPSNSGEEGEAEPSDTSKESGDAEGQSGDSGGKPGSGGNTPMSPETEKPEGAPSGSAPQGEKKSQTSKEKSSGKSPKGQGEKGSPSGSQQQKSSESGTGGKASSSDGGPGGAGSQAQSGPSSPMDSSQSGPGSGSPNADNIEHSEGSDKLSQSEEAVDLENRKKAAGLAINKLLEEMSRGEQPNDLMDELGYSEEDLENFLKQLDQGLNQRADQLTPEAQARQRQFEELLKGIELDSKNELRSGNTAPREASQSTGSTRRPTPKKYETSEEAFRRRMQKAK